MMKMWEPTAEPTMEPTKQPSTQPSSEPTKPPSANPTTEPTGEPTIEPTMEDDENVEILGFEFELEILIAIGVVGLIIISSSILVVFCICRRKDIWIDEDDSVDYGVTNLSGPKEHDYLDVRHTPFTVTEEEHEEMLELARQNSESVGL